MTIQITISGLPRHQIKSGARRQSNHDHLTTSWLKKKLRLALPMTAARSGSWHIDLIADAAMTEIHQRTLGINTTTDVLTFDLRDHTTDRRFLELETLIGWEVACRQARQFHHPVAWEVLLYAIHSLLHVQGYDDRTPRQARRIHRREDQILLALGIGPVYAAGANAGLQTRLKGVGNTMVRT
ncbi:MAG: rRNA maturation RNase YbeY [Phycisphaerae bacterium]|nr:rRNA maturation RNase YbeY [Phycisphaerae bacterium]